MKVVKSDGVYIVRIDKGESVMDELVKFAKGEGIKSGVIVGIGAVADPTLSYFDVESKKYITMEFKGEYELLACTGNFSVKEGEVFPHLHVVLGDKNFSTIGGHLNACKISGAGEFFVRPFSERVIHRQYSEEVGLFIWDL